MCILTQDFHIKLFQFLNLIYNLLTLFIAIVETLCRLHSDLCCQYKHNISTCQNVICTGLDVPVVSVQSRCEVTRASINTRQADAGVNGNLTVTTLRKERTVSMD